jgi:hypothetical protein
MIRPTKASDRITMSEDPRCGWNSKFPHFRSTSPRFIRESLSAYVKDAGHEQVRAWDISIPPLQHEVAEILQIDTAAPNYSTILEYTLPMESRRTDVIFLAKSSVVVLELKGKLRPSQADIDQAAAYVRDLRCYHRECVDRPVLALCVPMKARGYLGHQHDVHILGPDAVDRFVENLPSDPNLAPIAPNDFLAESAYRPLPTLVQAARELFEKGDLRPIRRARAATDPAVFKIKDIIHEAAGRRKKRLILVTGVPGAGKTLVGLRTVHAHYLDDLAVPRENGKPSAPAVFLSGNGPLVEVLQYELCGAGGGGKTFVRGVKEYVKRYSSRPGLIPPEHVLVFDEAQRAFDAEQVQIKHADVPGFIGGKSEPEHFIEFAERIPEWCAVIGLIGSGQEIHIGEEGGLIQWRQAVEGSVNPRAWIVHGPPQVCDIFQGSSVRFEESPALSLDTEIRFHLASEIHEFVNQLLEGAEAQSNAVRAEKLESQGYHLRISRDLQKAEAYLKERYGENPDARYGLVASSKDRDLERFGIANDYQSTKRVRYGPWYSNREDAPGAFSCRHLRDAITEFGAQGLELDAVLLAWGTDFIRENGRWTNRRARGYQRRAQVRNPFQLRKNSYRVLLTRGRDGTVVFIPPLPELKETSDYLMKSGFRPL